MNLLKHCSAFLSWKVVISLLAVVVGLIVCGVIPQRSLGVAPVLLIAACLIPCLAAPLALLRGRHRPAQHPTTGEQDAKL